MNLHEVLLLLIEAVVVQKIVRTVLVSSRVVVIGLIILR